MTTDLAHQKGVERHERIPLEDFDGCYVMCPLCRRDNVPLRFYAGGIVLDEHSIPMPVVARPEPVDPSASCHAPRGKLAWVHCPASLAPLIQAEGA